MASSTRKEDSAFREFVTQFCKDIISTLPQINRKTRKLKQQLDPKQHPNFIYPLPNPTIATFDPLKLKSGELKPEQFYGIHSSVVIFAPSHYWNGQFEVRCPCCKRPARLNGWNDDVRRVCGLLGTIYLIGARYKCVGCPENQKAMQYKAAPAGEHAFDMPDLPCNYDDDDVAAAPQQQQQQQQQQASTAQQDGKKRRGRKPKAAQQQQQQQQQPMTAKKQTQSTVVDLQQQLAASHMQQANLLQQLAQLRSELAGRRGLGPAANSMPITHTMRADTGHEEVAGQAQYGSTAAAATAAAHTLSECNLPVDLFDNMSPAEGILDEPPPAAATAAAAAAAAADSRHERRVPAAEAAAAAATAEVPRGRQQRSRTRASVSALLPEQQHHQQQQQHSRPLSFAQHVNKSWGSHVRRTTLSDTATAVATKDEKALWRKLYFQYTPKSKTCWQKFLKDFNTVAELQKSLQKRQNIPPSVFHKSIYWLQQYEHEEVRAAQENYPLFVSAVSMQWAGSAAGIGPGLSQSETSQYVQLMRMRAATDAAAAAAQTGGAAAAAEREEAAAERDGGAQPLPQDPFSSATSTDPAAAAAAASGANAENTSRQQQQWALLARLLAQQQQFITPVDGHSAAGLSANLSSGLDLGPDTFGMPWQQSAGGDAPAAAAAEQPAADGLGGQGQRHRLMSKRAAEHAGQQQQKRPKQYKKQRCQQCWNHRAADQGDGRPGKASHFKWGMGFCQLPCAVCKRPMQQHTAPCPRPAD